MDKLYPLADLIAEAEVHFGDLGEGEKRFLAEATPGVTVSFLENPEQDALEFAGSTITSAGDPENDPVANKGFAGQPKRLIRAAFIRWLLLHARAPQLFGEAGIEIFGARIEGFLDLSFCHIPWRLHFFKCWFGGKDPAFPAPTMQAGQVSLRFTKVLSFSLSACVVDGEICLRGATFDRSLFLRRGMRAHAVELCGARIDGDLHLEGAQLRGVPMEKSAELRALWADGLRVAGAIHLSHGFTAFGLVDLHRATIDGDVEGSGGTFCNARGVALRLRKADIKGSVLLRHSSPFGLPRGKRKHEEMHPTRVLGQIELETADIRGSLLFSGARLIHPRKSLSIVSSHLAVQADGVKVGGQVKIDWAHVTGQLRFENATIGGDFYGEAAHLSPASLLRRAADKGRRDSQQKVLSLEKARIDGSVVLWRSEQGFRRDEKCDYLVPTRLLGVVDLRSTYIKGNLVFTGAQVGKPAQAPAPFSPYQETTDEDRVISSGERLQPTATDPQPPSAITAEGVEVEGRVCLDGGFAATGRLDLRAARIRGDLNVRGCKVVNLHGVALELQSARVGGSLLLEAQPPRQEGRYLLPSRDCEIRGCVNLASARIEGNLSIRGVLCQASFRKAASGGRLRQIFRYSINAYGATVCGNVHMDRSLYAGEETNAQVVPDTHEPERRACFHGTVNFAYATISGSVSIFCADFDADLPGAGNSEFPRESALRMEGARIEGSIKLREHSPHPAQRRGASFRGGIDLRNAHVRGNVKLSTGILLGDFCVYDHEGLDRSHRPRDDNGRPAFWASNAVIDGYVSLADCAVFGAITLYSTRIGGRLNLRDIKNALRHSGVELPPRPHVKKGLLIEEPQLASDGEGEEDPAERAKEAKNFRLYLAIDLYYARCDVLQVDGVAVMHGCLVLEGLQYRGLEFKKKHPEIAHDNEADDEEADDQAAEEHEEEIPSWLKLQHSKEWHKRLEAGHRGNDRARYLTFPPQPYQLVATVLERQGLEEDAQQVTLARVRLERHILRAQRASHVKMVVDPISWRYAWLRIEKRVLNHGYGRIRPFASLLGLWLLGTVIFSFAKLEKVFVPVQEVAWHEVSEGKPHPVEGWSPYYPELRPWLYSLDTLFPFVDFRQEEFWEPEGSWREERDKRLAQEREKTPPVADPPAGDPLPGDSSEGDTHREPKLTGGQKFWKWVTMYYRPLHIAAGWFFSTLAVISISGLLRQRRGEIPEIE
jgi:hypothetical protein